MRSLRIESAMRLHRAEGPATDGARTGERMMRQVGTGRVAVVGILAATLFLGGCANMSATEQRVVTGGAMGAAGGALIGAMAGNAGMGAAIGGLTGAAGGYVYDRHEKSKQAAYEQGVRDGKKQK